MNEVQVEATGSWSYSGNGEWVNKEWFEEWERLARESLDRPK
jgi:hypothetical protein